MSATAAALLAYAAWTTILVIMLGGLRVSLVLGGKKAPNDFKPDGDDIAGFGHRLTRAHANCFENLPAAGVLMLYAIATNQTAVTDGMALIFLGARIAQSAVHLISIHPMAVRIRLGFYIIQIGILVLWVLKLAHLI